MAVGPVEADAFAVEQHQAAPDLEAAQAHLLRHRLHPYAVPVKHLDGQAIQAGGLRAPQPGIVHGQDGLSLRRERNVGTCNLPLSVVQAAYGMARAHRLHGNAHLAGGEIIAERRGDLQVPDMHFRDGIQIYLTEEAGEPEEILVLHPAGVGVPEHLGGQLVLAGDQIVRQLELRRCEPVLAIAHIASVAPHGQTAFRPLEGDIDPLSRQTLRQGKVFHVAAHRIELFRDLPRLYIFAA